LTNILMNVSTKNLTGLKKVWKMKKDSVNRAEFSNLFLGLVREDLAYSEKEIVDTLCDLFDEIDVNCDNLVSWEEVVNFIERSGNAPSTEDSSQTAQEFILSSVVEEHRRHYDGVQFAKYLGGRLDKLAVLDRKQMLRLYDPVDLHVVYEVEAHTGLPLCVEYVPQLDLMVSSSVDHTVALWDVTNPSSLHLRARLPARHPQTALLWLPSRQKLIAGSTRGLIHTWIPGLVPWEWQEEASIAGHFDYVTDLIELPEVDMMASASLDTSVLLWNLETMEVKRKLHGHFKGVRSMCYDSENRLLCTAGFDCDMLLWNPFVSNPVMRLSGHTASLMGVRHIPNTNMVVSADMEANVKMWDIRTGTCLQTLKTPVHSPLTAMAVIPDSMRIVVSERRLWCFDFNPEEGRRPDAAHLTSILFAGYTSVYNMFVTVSFTALKTWNAATGEFIRAYRDPCSATITTAALGDNGRTVILGCENGTVCTLSLGNGTIVKTLEEEVEGEMLCSLSIPQIACYCIGGTSGSLLVLDDTQRLNLEIVYNWHGHEKDILVACIHKKSMKIYSGDADGMVLVWDLVSGTLDGAIVPFGRIYDIQPPGVLPAAATGSDNVQQKIVRKEVSCILPLADYPIVWVCTADGHVIGYGTESGAEKKGKETMRYPVIFRLKLEFADEAKRMRHCAHAMAFDEAADVLYVGDDLGGIQIFPLSVLFAKHNIRKSTSQPVKMEHDEFHRRSLLCANLSGADVVKSKIKKLVATAKMASVKFSASGNLAGKNKDKDNEKDSKERKHPKIGVVISPTEVIALHKLQVTQLSVLRGPEVLLTGSEDGRCMQLSLADKNGMGCGDLLGKLCQGGLEASHCVWKVDARAQISKEQVDLVDRMTEEIESLNRSGSWEFTAARVAELSATRGGKKKARRKRRLRKPSKLDDTAYFVTPGKSESDVTAKHRASPKLTDSQKRAASRLSSALGMLNDKVMAKEYLELASESELSPASETEMTRLPPIHPPGSESKT
jgi:WD40 repeat protein